MALVQFNQDVFPYCKGDVVNLEGEDKKRVDAVIEDRGLSNAYSKYEAPKEEKATK